jgi:hypothetical protein
LNLSLITPSSTFTIGQVLRPSAPAKFSAKFFGQVRPPARGFSTTSVDFR